MRAVLADIVGAQALIKLGRYGEALKQLAEIRTKLPNDHTPFIDSGIACGVPTLCSRVLLLFAVAEGVSGRIKNCDFRGQGSGA
eukprot:3483480-Rhodomonas_salina.1